MTLNGADSYGDGWGWAGSFCGRMDVTDGDGTVLLDDFTVDGAAAGSAIFSVNNGCPSGCTDPAAENYDSGAILDDGSCTFANAGCTDPNADNYDSSAVNDDGTCTYNPPNYISFTWVNTASWDWGGEVGPCDRHQRQLGRHRRARDGRPGAAGAVVQIPTQFVPNGCYQVVGSDSFGDGWDGYVMDITDGDGNVLVDNFGATFTDGDTVSAYLSIAGGCVFGCTDSAADNYDSGANVDDGNCTYDSPAAPTPQRTNYDSSATGDDGSCIYPAANNISFTWVETASYGGEASVDGGERADSTEAASGDATDAAALSTSPPAATTSTAPTRTATVGAGPARSGVWT